MLCQQCNQRPANVQITQTANNQKIVLYLCETCAGAKQDLINDFPFGMGNLLTSIMENIYGKSQMSVKETMLQCSRCGMTFEEFTRNGKFGCAECYSAFGPKLRPIFRRLHGSNTHNGKIPARLKNGKMTEKEIKNLKLKLEEAIKSEEYEMAAHIRDEIRALEGSKPKGNGGEKSNG